MYRIYDVIKSILRGLLACLVHVNGPTNRSHFITKYHLQMYLTQQALLKFIEIWFRSVHPCLSSDILYRQNKAANSSF